MAKPWRAAGEGAGVVGLAGEVHVVALNGEVSDAAAEAIGPCPEGNLQDAKRATAPQVPHVGQHSQGHVHGVTVIERPPLEM
jgi:hypothetical protein